MTKKRKPRTPQPRVRISKQRVEVRVPERRVQKERTAYPKRGG